jgi:hypothetical protein
MPSGERDLWRAIYAAAYVRRADGFSADGGSEHAHHAACMASEALGAIRRHVHDGTLPAVVLDHAEEALRGPAR